MTREICKTCNGSGDQKCDVSGVKVGKCENCEGNGIKPKIYYANVLTHKNIGEAIWMHSTLFDTEAEAMRYKHPEFVLIKTVEVKI